MIMVSKVKLVVSIVMIVLLLKVMLVLAWVDVVGVGCANKGDASVGNAVDEE